MPELKYYISDQYKQMTESTGSNGEINISLRNKDYYSRRQEKKHDLPISKLKLYDEDLVGVDPYDPNLSVTMQLKIIMECRRNIWYFVREVMRIPARY